MILNRTVTERSVVPSSTQVARIINDRYILNLGFCPREAVNRLDRLSLIPSDALTITRETDGRSLKWKPVASELETRADLVIGLVASMPDVIGKSRLDMATEHVRCRRLNNVPRQVDSYSSYSI